MSEPWYRIHGGKEASFDVTCADCGYTVQIGPLPVVEMEMAIECPNCNYTLGWVQRTRSSEPPTGDRPVIHVPRGEHFIVGNPGTPEAD